MAHPRSAFGAPPQGGDPSGRAEPVRGVCLENSTRRLLIGTAGLLSVAALRPVLAQPRKLRFGVGPLLPNPEDTKKAYMPVFAHLARQLGADFDLVATTDWAGMAVAMASGNLDVAWMGPWGYIIANNQTGCQ